MVKNRPIKNNTDRIGFLLTIIEIPKKILMEENKSKKIALYPLQKVSIRRYKSISKLTKFTIKCNEFNLAIVFC